MAGVMGADSAGSSAKPGVNVTADAATSGEFRLSLDGDPLQVGAEGVARLVERVTVNGYTTGALQVFCEGEWGGVCITNFDDADALVACRQLGFDSGVALPRGLQRESPLMPNDPLEIPRFALDNLGCSGTEARLIDCPQHTPEEPEDTSDYGFRAARERQCNPYSSDSFVVVACGDNAAAGEGDVRLALGAVAEDGSAEYGRLEVFHNGGWGTVCEDKSTFSEGAADVVCMQLGFQQGFQVQTLEVVDQRGTARTPIFVSGADCSGSEATLTMCPGVDLGSSLSSGECTHDSDVNLVCFNSAGPGAAMDGRTRLMGGSSGPGFEYGRLEIFARGFWSNVCRAGRFTPDAAQVACRALGYDGGAALRFIQPYANQVSPVLFANLPVALAGVDCDGGESGISECRSNSDRIQQCAVDSSSTVLACSNTAPECDQQDGPTEGSVRLRGGFGTPCDPVHSGFIEVLHDGEWGGICTDWPAERSAEDNLVADVVCRQLGFPHGTRIDPLEAVPPRSDSTPFYSGDYAAVEEAEEPVERFWLRAPSCAGPEGRLTDCNLGRGFREDNAGCPPDSFSSSLQPHRLHIACRQFAVPEALEDITTPGAEEGDVRLVDQEEIANWVAGRLEVFLEGSWGQVCEDNPRFTGRVDGNADVACRQLGFGAGTIAPRPRESSVFTDDLERSATVFPEVKVIGLACNGTEVRVLDCDTVAPDVDVYESGFTSDYLYGSVCESELGTGLVIACVVEPLEGAAAGTEGDLRLTNESPGASEGSVSGVLEVFHAGAWGSVGTTAPIRGIGISATEENADVACQELGFVAGAFGDVHLSPPADVRVPPPWLTIAGISCIGFEPDTADDYDPCRRFRFGDNPASGSAQRLFCYTTNDDNGEVRLEDGSSDPERRWAYGRLEVIVNGVWSVIPEDFNRDFDGRRAPIDPACRALGFETGAQLFVWGLSPFPAALPGPQLAGEIICEGTEEQLVDCDISLRDYAYYDVSEPDEELRAVALVCATPSGCDSPVQTPSDGDVRLVPVRRGSGAPHTAACDEVHFGVVEMFRDGAWNLLCARDPGRFAGPGGPFSDLDAAVVCRQLGFPFGTTFNEDDSDDADSGAAGGGAYGGAAGPRGVIDAEVFCMGKEERLTECNISLGPGTGADLGSDYAEQARASCRIDDRRFAVVCRRFEIQESAAIRR